MENKYQQKIKNLEHNYQQKLQHLLKLKEIFPSTFAPSIRGDQHSISWLLKIKKYNFKLYRFTLFLRKFFYS